MPARWPKLWGTWCRWDIPKEVRNPPPTHTPRWSRLQRWCAWMNVGMELKKQTNKQTNEQTCVARYKRLFTPKLDQYCTIIITKYCTHMNLSWIFLSNVSIHRQLSLSRHLPKVDTSLQQTVVLVLRVSALESELTVQGLGWGLRFQLWFGSRKSRTLISWYLGLQNEMSGVLDCQLISSILQKSTFELGRFYVGKQNKDLDLNETLTISSCYSKCHGNRTQKQATLRFIVECFNILRRDDYKAIYLGRNTKQEWKTNWSMNEWMD